VLKPKYWVGWSELNSTIGHENLEGKKGAVVIDQPSSKASVIVKTMAGIHEKLGPVVRPNLVNWYVKTGSRLQLLDVVTNKLEELLPGRVSYPVQNTTDKPYQMKTTEPTFGILAPSPKDTMSVPVSIKEEQKLGKARNTLTEENIEKIYSTYAKRKEIEKFSRKVNFKEIEENGFNLNITRYVDTFVEEDPIDIKANLKELAELEPEIEKLEKQMDKYLKELGIR
jgi:hypothetical protein